jgi:hypothetical protein
MKKVIKLEKKDLRNIINEFILNLPQTATNDKNIDVSKKRTDIDPSDVILAKGSDGNVYLMTKDGEILARKPF